MKTKGKAWQLIVTVLLIAAFVYTAFFGVAVKYGDVTTPYLKGAKDIRFGVDIKGGVNVTFVPSDDYDATDDQLEAAQLVIENRLVALNVTDYELYVDNNSDSLILEFPWQSGETNFDPEAAIEEIGTTAYLTFREGSSADGELILDGSMVESAAAQYGPVSGSSSEYYVALKFTDEGAKRSAMLPPGCTSPAAPSASGWTMRMSARRPSMPPSPMDRPSSPARHPTRSPKRMSSRWPARSTPARCLSL
ncbi:hypothetical protein [Faecalibacterium sp. OF04-11AC]|uniref:hypothetical protein n=1 Tax=Faecalibacterium sp. OF04-11AC TaxID=2293109 RepID=UPI001FA8C8A7|nr:hypothetical protein [Faecalibacterium sp. OF04-11AC]